MNSLGTQTKPVQLAPNPAGRASFFERTRGAKRVLVLDLGFLGDTVHLLPALWTMRQAYPGVELHAMVSEHITSLLAVTPWIDRVWGYPRFPKRASLAQNVATVRALRKERFDVVINLNGSDRSSWLTFLSGAKERLGRLPFDGGPWFWRSMFTEVIEHPHFQEPVYWQKWRCLQNAGFPGAQPEFHIEINSGLLAAAQITGADAGTFFHLSPFTTSDRKGLPLAQIAELANGLSAEFPARKLALSCAPTDRERRKLEQLLALLKFKPWRVFAGTLDLIRLTALIQMCALNLSGDSGTLHLAVMTGVPTVSWWSPQSSFNEFMPAGRQHRMLVATGVEAHGLTGLTCASLLGAVRELLP